MSRKGRAPIRTCIGCREKKEKEEMIWLVKGAAGAVVVNGTRPHQGRGFYLCSDRCLDLAKKRRKGAGSLEIADFRFPSETAFEEGRKVRDTGGRG